MYILTLFQNICLCSSVIVRQKLVLMIAVINEKQLLLRLIFGWHVIKLIFIFELFRTAPVFNSEFLQICFKKCGSDQFFICWKLPCTAALLYHFIFGKKKKLLYQKNQTAYQTPQMSLQFVSALLRQIWKSI